MTYLSNPIETFLGTKHDLNFVYDFNDHILVTDPSILREEALKRNADIVECDVCGAKGNRPNMSRWHFDKCGIKQEVPAQRKEVEIEGIRYKSGAMAAKALGVSNGAISQWVKRCGSRYGITIPIGANSSKYRE